LYALQQIRQFQQLGEAFMIQHTHTAEMDQQYAALKDAFVQSLTSDDLAALSLDVKDAFVQSLTPEDLAALSPEERLSGLSTEERLSGLSPEERLSGLSADERRRAAEDLLNALPDEDRRRLLQRLLGKSSSDPGTTGES
jgi:hypothetical protein